MKRNRIFLLLVTAVIFAVAFSSFTGDDPPFKGYIKADDGSYFLWHTKGAGLITADTGGAVFVKWKFKTGKDSVFFDVNQQSQSGSFPMRVEEAKFKGDFFDYIMRMHIGDSLSFFIPMDSLSKYYPGEFKFDSPFDTLKYLGFACKVDSIYTREKVQKLVEEAKIAQEERDKEIAKMKEEEPALLKKYIADNKIKARPSATGVYYIQTKKGTGKTIVQGQTVSIRYVGKFIDGTIFDSNQTPDAELLTFVLGEHFVIPGMEEATLKMKKGEHGTMIIPSSQAYGDGAGRMKPYATLIFDVEVIDVRDTPLPQ
jgi:FKBP-type peptidyl-prolyl cis-trans isomerase